MIMGEVEEVESLDRVRLIRRPCVRVRSMAPRIEVNWFAVMCKLTRQHVKYFSNLQGFQRKVNVS